MKLTATGLPFGESPMDEHKDMPNTFVMEDMKQRIREDETLDTALKHLCVKAKAFNVSKDEIAAIMAESMKLEADDMFPNMSHSQVLEIVRQLVVEYMENIS